MTLAFDVLPSSPTWNIIDNSKLSTFKDCPRKYFFEYILGWRSAFPSNDLVFGTSWHMAVEHLLLKGYGPEALNEAKLVFALNYRDSFDQSTDELFEPKNLQGALTGLSLYAQRFQSDMTKYNVLHTEVGIAVLIAPERTLYMKLDAIVEEKKTELISFIDHKTSKRKQSNWDMSWQLSGQMLLYLFTLYCMYPHDKVDKGIVRGAFFYKDTEAKRKKGEEPVQFDQANVSKNFDQLQMWLDSTNYWYERLELEMKRLGECSSDDTTMKAFPQNDQACNKYYGCPYLEHCVAWPNPLQGGRLTRVPPDFKVEHWNPVENPLIREHLEVLP